MFTNPEDFQRRDWALLQNGAVNIFRREEHLQSAECSLEALGYRLSRLTYQNDMDAFRDQVSSALNWREQFGYESWSGNLNALNDGFRYYPFGPTRRAALVLRNFHRLAADDAQLAHHFLDIMEYSARDHLLAGNLFIALIQTDDPDYRSGPLGARGGNWNNAEWLVSNRS